MMKKAIVVVSFGTTYQEGLRLNIESVENKIKANFPEYEVRRAFTSRIVIKRLAARDGIHIDTETEAIQRLEDEGYKEVYVQPLHVVGGEEYDKIKKIVVQYIHGHQKAFDKIVIGRPLLYYTGQEDRPDDYVEAIEALTAQLPKVESKEAIVFMGHGGIHPANTAYAALQMKIEEAGLNHIFVYTVEGFPPLESVIAKLKKRDIKKVILMPFMLVAGDHVNNDMAGDDEDSAKSQLVKAGFTVDVYLHGLGENTKIQDLYVQHLKDAMSQKAGHGICRH
ncbi:sirohydrochlorin cobaltochelatase [Pelosinus baikalensis]|uniref:Sirohydrochlorin cobaltochelatase n=1 Tax=Pelosinus baikalensis TaxID=2892015 RepID=A0ABS8HSD1_9FIRM|nr:sirohydrochlorin cobaltochelatase [Pelosinus baikalensis]MCC5465985.1 sirohydrochlorin cobaltochelatase [Pelosinus baikalensis]